MLNTWQIFSTLASCYWFITTWFHEKSFFYVLHKCFLVLLTLIYLSEKKRKDELKGCRILGYGNAYVYGNGLGLILRDLGWFWLREKRSPSNFICWSISLLETSLLGNIWQLSWKLLVKTNRSNLRLLIKYFIRGNFRESNFANLGYIR